MRESPRCGRGPRVLAVCLNPAWQKTLHLPRLALGQVNRADAQRDSGGGKGINLSRAVRCCGGDVATAQFAGGETGRRLVAELDAAGVEAITVSTVSPTRVCTTLISDEPAAVTEIIEPSGPVTPAEVAELRQRILDALPRFDGVALCGTFPPGVDPEFYAAVAAAARPRAVVLLDGYRGVEAALRAGVDVLKVNADELRVLTGAPDPAAGAAVCFRQWRVDVVAVTAGPGAAVLFARDQAFDVQPPALPAVVNSTGAGDCAAGVLLHGLAARRAGEAGTAAGVAPAAVADALAAALACATASCLTEVPAMFDPATAATLRARVRVTPRPPVSARTAGAGPG